MSNSIPNQRPARPFFSSGPTAKPEQWSISLLENAMVGRSHRDQVAVDKIQELCQRQKKLLKIPENFKVGAFVGSNSAALETALWNLLGPRPVDALVFDNFSSIWLNDVQQLAKNSKDIPQINVLGKPFKELPNLDQVNPKNDCLITWHGTPSAIIIPHDNFISEDREGITIVDATSAVFCLDMPWNKFDAVTWSWQKALGGEPGVGMLALSPKAWNRLEEHRTSWPVPSIINIRNKDGSPNIEPFEGKTLITISLLAIEDALNVTKIAEDKGLENMIKHSWDGMDIIETWLKNSPNNFEFLIKEKEWRSPVAIAFTTPDNPQKAYEIASILSKEGIAFDIKGHKSAPPCIRIWNGPTVNHEDISSLLPWIDWAFNQNP